MFITRRAQLNCLRGYSHFEKTGGANPKGSCLVIPGERWRSERPSIMRHPQVNPRLVTVDVDYGVCSFAGKLNDTDTRSPMET